MSIPLATTTISVLRLPLDPARDPADAPPEREMIVSAVRAVISSPMGTENQLGGTQSVMDFRLAADPCDLLHTDQVLDESSGQVYSATWVAQRTGLQLDHVEAGLRVVRGEQ